jgi:hypothetical protein
MRKLGILLALTCTLAGIGVSAPNASAASCIAGQGSIYYDGNLRFYSYLWHCTSVDTVQFRRYINSTFYSGIRDIAVADHVAPAGINPDVSSQAIFNLNTTVSVTWAVPTWGCLNPPGRLVHSQFVYRLHNTANGGSWGSWWVQNSSAYAIWC